MNETTIIGAFAERILIIYYSEELWLYATLFEQEGGQDLYSFSVKIFLLVTFNTVLYNRPMYHVTCTLCRVTCNVYYY